MPYLVLYYEEDKVHCAYWQSKKGYFYCQYEDSSKPKRISGKSYMSAYEMYYNL